MSRLRTVSYLLPVALLGVLLVTTDLGQFRVVLSGTDAGWYLLGAVVFGLSYVPLTLRWAVLLRSADYHPSLYACFEMVGITYGLNKILPANIGDASRSVVSNWYIDVDEHSELLGLVAFERAMDLLVVAALVVAAGLLRQAPGTGRLLAASGAVGLLVLGLFLASSVSAVRDSVRGFSPSHVADTVDNLVFAYDRLPSSAIGAVAGLSMLRWMLGMGSLVPVAVALGIDLHLPTAVLVVGAMSIVTVIPLSPGGIGPVETVGVWVLVMTGVGSGAAFALVVLQRSFGLLLMAVLGLLLYGNRMHRLPVEEG